MLNNVIAQRSPSLGICIWLIVLFCLPSQAFSFDRTIQQYVHTAWGDKEGAPTGILALAQTTDGYLWIGGVDGLYRFDGVTFERYEPGLVYALLALPNGDLWIGRKAVISRLRNGKETTYTEQDGVPSGKVAGFAEDGEGTIWVATNVGLARFENNRWIQVGKDWNFHGKLATGMCLDRNGTLWVATESTILFLPRGARRFQTTGISTGEVWMIVEAPNGKLWMAETTRSVRPVPLGTDLPPSDKTEIVAGSIGILFDRDGSLWITTIGKGLRRVSHPEELAGQKYEDQNKAKAIEAFTSKDGLTSDLVTAIVQDREGNIWVGTNNGLDCFRKGALVPVVSPVPLFQPVFGAGDNGDMWIASDYYMVKVRVSGELEIIPTRDLYLGAYRDSQGIVWWSENGAVVGMKNGRFVRVPPKTTKAPFTLLPYVTEDHDGVLWAAVDYDGVFYLKDDAWRRFETPPEIKKPPAAAYTDWTGRIWFGFDDGGALVTLDHGKLRVLASSGQSPVGDAVKSIAGRSEHIWIGGSKLVYFDGRDFHEVVPFDTASFKVYGIEETHDGSLWLCENRGVIHVPSTEVEKFLNDFSYRVHYDLFDSADGLPGSFHDAAARSREALGTDGRLWFSATKGVAWLDPAAISKNTLPPHVVIRSVEDDGRSYRGWTDLKLPPRLANLEISYTALSLSIPSRVRFRYKLEGIDDDWQNPGTRREAFYTGLSPGKYRFRVIACNNDGVWNNVGATLDFSVAPAWFQTNWFLALCFVITMFVVWTLYRLRMRQVARALSARFDERLAERTRVARELHDTFLQTVQGSKMVADDALDRPNDPARMRRAMEQLSTWLGQATQEGRAALNSLRASTTEKNDLAGALQRAVDECRIHSSMQGGLSVVGDAKELHPVVRDEVYRIGYEAIRNACIHSGGTRLQVGLNYAQDLAVRVSDNGVGMEPDIAEKGKVGHFGLQGMRERAFRIGGKLSVITSPRSGTEITIIVPGRVAFRKPSTAQFERIRSLFRPS
jgi:signal transduction histidine kinase/ligand-binding sensor domain-containing protein